MRKKRKFNIRFKIVKYIFKTIIITRNNNVRNYKHD